MKRVGWKLRGGIRSAGAKLRGRVLPGLVAAATIAAVPIGIIALREDREPATLAATTDNPVPVEIVGQNPAAGGVDGFDWENAPSAPMGPNVALMVSTSVRLLGDVDPDAWVPEKSVAPGTKLEALVRFRNDGPDRADDLMVGMVLPNRLTQIANTTRLANGANPDGVAISNENLSSGGLNVGHYLTGAVGYVWVQVRVAEPDEFACGRHPIVLMGAVRTGNAADEVSDGAIIHIVKSC